MLFEHHHCGIKCYLDTKFHLLSGSLGIYICANVCPYYNVWPGAIFCCYNKKYKILYDVACRVHELHVSAKLCALI